jgi:hypothetical protein
MQQRKARRRLPPNAIEGIAKVIIMAADGTQNSATKANQKHGENSGNQESRRGAITLPFFLFCWSRVSGK